MAAKAAVYPGTQDRTQNTLKPAALPRYNAADPSDRQNPADPMVKQPAAQLPMIRQPVAKQPRSIQQR